MGLFSGAEGAPRPCGASTPHPVSPAPQAAVLSNFSQLHPGSGGAVQECFLEEKGGTGGLSFQEPHLGSLRASRGPGVLGSGVLPLS